MFKAISKATQTTGLESPTIATLTKPVSVAALMLALGTAGVSAHAATLNVGDILTINPGLYTGTPGLSDTGALEVACSGISNPADGSCFGLQSPGGVFWYSAISGKNGIVIGSIQPASGSSGMPTGLENPNIDNVWTLFYDSTVFNGPTSTGMHQTTSPITQLTSTATGGTLDFSGWNMTYGGNPSIPLGTGGLCWGTGDPAANGSNCNGSASFQWDGIYGHQYQLWYNATNAALPENKLNYRLHLVGTVQAATVPLPAAVWLLGSGLVGLVGFSRHRVKSQ
jgi:hypothetical protein